MPTRREITKKYALAGVDFDNGSEFMYWGVLAWADKKDIPVTRGGHDEHNEMRTSSSATVTGFTATPAGFATATKPSARSTCSTNSGLS